jgi:hypothetical protein
MENPFAPSVAAQARSRGVQRDDLVESACIYPANCGLSSKVAAIMVHLLG